MLAAKVVLDQGVRVEGLNFFTGFCVEGHTHAIRKQDRAKPKRNNALWVAEQLGIKLHFVDVVEEYKSVVLNPKHGYGAEPQPVPRLQELHGGTRERLDAGARLRLHRDRGGGRTAAHVAAPGHDADRGPGIGSGGQAPSALVRETARSDAARARGLGRSRRLHDFHGRSRKPQMALAAHFGFTDYAQPAGGCCFLTNRQYASKLADLWDSRGRRDYDLDDIMLLKVGRHLRPRPHFKVIVAREEGENRYLNGYRKRFTHLRTVSHEGPLTLVDGAHGEEDLLLTARMTARFSQGRDARQVTVEIVEHDGESRTVDVVPLHSDEIPSSWYI